MRLLSVSLRSGEREGSGPTEEKKILNWTDEKLESDKSIFSR